MAEWRVPHLSRKSSSKREVYKVFVSGNRRDRRVMTALRDLNLAVHKGEFLALIGRPARSALSSSAAPAASDI